MTKEEQVTEEIIYASYPVFKGRPQALAESERDIAAKEVGALLEEWSDRVSTRGIYSSTGFTARADIMFWFVSSSTDHLQDLVALLRRTALGRALEQTDMFLGVVRPAEFAKDHSPAFVQGTPPKKYTTVYPFVRTPEWYLLDPAERNRILREHGAAGREFPDILANTTSAFGLGDYEWILCFEADEPVRLVELIRRLRATEARRYTKLEVPFITGIRKDILAAVADLP